MESKDTWFARIALLSGVTPIPVKPAYIRNEPRNRLSLLSPDGKQIYTILNKVAKEILDFCDGTHDLPEMLHLLKNRYSNQPDEMLARDLAVALQSMTKNCLITWKKEGKCMNSPFGYNYRATINSTNHLFLADESRFAEIEEAAAKSLSTRRFKGDSRIYFSEFDIEPELENLLILRQRIFSFAHDFFLLSNQFGEINGLIICEPTPNPIGRSVTIKFISCNSELLAPALDRLAEYYKSLNHKNYYILKINVPVDTPITKRLDCPDECLDFALAGILPNELDSGDVKIYVRLLSKEQQ
ncbi:MAG: PqqD family protein [Collinsella stercoris]|nr:PqqD family protein [Collinsella stercoris]